MNEASPFAQPKPRGIVRRFVANLGPGLITGAADDDPFRDLDLLCSRCGLRIFLPVDGSIVLPIDGGGATDVRAAGDGDRAGLGGAIRLRYPSWVLWPACVLLIVANVFNIGADLGGMADAMQMVTGIRSYYWTPF